MPQIILARNTPLSVTLLMLLRAVLTSAVDPPTAALITTAMSVTEQLFVYSS